MKCPSCSCHDSRVLDSRPVEDFSSIRRRRECVACGKRFTTYEMVETVPLFVIKKDGTKEPFDRHKLQSGLMKACQKRPVDVEALCADIENELVNTLESEVSSIRIGEIAMEKLKGLDEVSYVRFASVYREFRDLETFLEELKTLVKGKKKKK
ncbi:MAG: transcriptional regulator NrdR [Eubacteriales bacterium]|nr:transcriptional regulator NrdR [Clostridia bacterium]MDY6185235.1 transcriptional regulator NrdR [Eubacteriales bacterium]